MKKLVGFFILTLALNAWSQEAVVDLKMRPSAASFKAKSKDVRGSVMQKGDEVEAKNIIVGLKNIDTERELRDKHTKEYLQVDKYPEAILVSAKGKGGKGDGIIRIRGIEKPISGTYKIEGSNLKAEFPIKLSDFGITGIKYMGLGVDDNAIIHVTVPISAASAAVSPAPAAKPTAAPPKKK